MSCLGVTSAEGWHMTMTLAAADPSALTIIFFIILFYLVLPFPMMYGASLCRFLFYTAC